MIIFDVIPVPKPRMTQRDKWMERDATAAYWAYKEELGYKANLQKFKIGTIIDLIFIMPFKDIFNDDKKKALNGKSHQERPDIDNLIKGFLDALLKKDEEVWQISAKKYWGEKGAILILRNETKEGHFILEDYLTQGNQR